MIWHIYFILNGKVKYPCVSLCAYVHNIHLTVFCYKDKTSQLETIKKLALALEEMLSMANNLPL